MRLYSPANLLWLLVEQMGATRVDISINQTSRSDFYLGWEGKGKDIKIEDVDVIGGVLTAEGRHIVLYIPDHGTKIENVLNNEAGAGNKVHISYCKTLIDMRRRNRYERYRAVANTTFQGFDVSGNFNGKEITGEADLKVCKNCLKYLNYKGYAAVKERRIAIYNKFDPEEFFLSYSTFFPALPSAIVDKWQGGYVSDWKQISRKFREKKRWRCESCKLDLSSYENLLHTHHVDGDKKNNNPSNLKALCADCHRKQPKHGHMGIESSDMELIQRLRNAQGVMNYDSWGNIYRLVDMPFRDLLYFYKNRGRAMPTVGYDIVSHETGLKVQAQFAWPNKKIAIVREEQQKRVFEQAGWTARTLQEELEMYV